MALPLLRPDFGRGPATPARYPQLWRCAARRRWRSVRPTAMSALPTKAAALVPPDRPARFASGQQAPCPATCQARARRRQRNRARAVSRPPDPRRHARSSHFSASSSGRRCGRRRTSRSNARLRRERGICAMPTPNCSRRRSARPKPIAAFAKRARNWRRPAGWARSARSPRASRTRSTSRSPRSVPSPKTACAISSAGSPTRCAATSTRSSNSRRASVQSPTSCAISRGAKPTPLGPVALQSAIEGTSLLIGDRLRAQGIALDIVVEGPTPSVHADRVRLEQVLVNLLQKCRRRSTWRQGPAYRASRAWRRSCAHRHLR